MNIDFTDFPKRNKTYAGANGSKISIVYKDELYMLKFPPHPSKNREMSYSNSCFSEYLGCKVFKSIGIPVQEVILGTYTIPNGDEKIVVACKDFTAGGKVIQDFASLKNQIIDSEKNGYGTELHDILETFEIQNAVDSKELSTRFWHMFIVDALIGNWDRHNGNWGFLYQAVTDTMELAPVFDCGSCMYPQADNDIMKEILNDRQKLNHRIYNIPTSAIKEDDSRINYFDFISSLRNEDCNEALKYIQNCIDLNEINTIIDDMPFATELQKIFYKTLISERKEHIIDYSLKKLFERK